jgi:hypothetical protein
VLPTFAVIGAMKAGTTSIYAALNKHPQVFMCSPKEPQFFTTRWDRGLVWYESLFAGAGDAVARGDASTSYTDFPRKPQAAARIHRVIPEIQLVYVVRDPVARMRSHYRHRVADGTERRPVDVALLDDRYLNRSRYALQIEQYLRFFSSEQLLVLRCDDVLNGGEPWARLLNFIGADSAYEPETATHANVTDSKLRLRPTTRALRQRFKGTALYRYTPGPLRTAVRRAGARTATVNDEAAVTPELHDAIWARLQSDMQRFAELTGIVFSRASAPVSADAP